MSSYKQAKVQQGPDVRWKNRGRPLIKTDGHFVVTTPIVFQAQSEQSSRVSRIQLNRFLVQRDDFLRVAAHGSYGGSTLISVLGGLLDGAKHRIQDVHRLFHPIGVTESFDYAEIANVFVVTTFGGGFVSGDRVVVFFLSKICFSQIEIGDRRHCQRWSTYQRSFDSRPAGNNRHPA